MGLGFNRVCSVWGLAVMMLVGFMWGLVVGVAWFSCGFLGFMVCKVCRYWGLVGRLIVFRL